MSAVDRVYREQWGRLLAMLAVRFRDLDLAEEALADAFEAAAREWPTSGVPDNPPAWLMTVARRGALDRIRRQDTARRALPLLVTDAIPPTEGADAVTDPTDDDELRLLLLTCHPALAPTSQAALALRLVLGVETHEIARLFLTSDATVAARITRAKRKIARAGLPLSIPADDRLDERLRGVIDTIYLCFTAGYAPGQGGDVVRSDLAGEAIRLARLLLVLLRSRSRGGAKGADVTVRALLALMLLQHARRDARVDADGDLVLLRDQDRTRWHADEIAEGMRYLAGIPVTSGHAEELRLQATLAAHHSARASADTTDWNTIAATYERLERLTGSPVVRLNRAVAVAEASGPREGLRLLDGLDALLPQSHRVPAVRAELLVWVGETAAARDEFRTAVSRCEHDAERAHLERRLADLDD